MTTYWWLSFVDRIPDEPEVGLHLGVCIVLGDDLNDAIRAAWRIGCNPGGEVVGHRLALPGIGRDSATDRIDRWLRWPGPAAEQHVQGPAGRADGYGLGAPSPTG